MKLFHCIRQDRKGYQSENFFREGETEESVLDELNVLGWPSKGTWEVCEVGSENKDEWGDES